MINKKLWEKLKKELCGYLKCQILIPKVKIEIIYLE